MLKPKILVCAATGTEAHACSAGIRKAGLLDEGFEVLKTGIGAENAAKALGARLQNGSKPRLIISGGFAGSWSEELHVGQWIFGESVTRDRSFDSARTPPKSFALSPFSFAQAATVCSVGEIYETPPSGLLEKLKLLKKPVAVDMESFALAEVAHREGISFGVLRYITDSPSQSLPSFVRHFTEVATESDSFGKARSLARGTQALFSEFAQVGALLKNGSHWRKELAAGWEQFAKTLYESVRDQ